MFFVSSIKKHRKALAVCLFVALGLMLAFAVTAFATEVFDGAEGESALEYSGSCGPNAVWNFDPETGEVYVRGFGEMMSVGWTAFADQIRSVVIEEGITSVRHEAFEFCRSLERVSMPSTVTSIGTFAFYSCSSLESVDLPASLLTIGRNAFGECDSLTSITLPDGITTLEYEAFGRCDALEEIFIPASVTQLDHNTFYSSPWVKVEVASDNPMYKSTDGALYSKDGTVLISVPISEKDLTFFVNDSVLEIVPSSWIGRQLQSVEVDESNPAFSVREGVLYDKSFENIIFVCKKFEGEITVPSSVSQIGEYTFQSSSLSELVFEEGSLITELPYAAFRDMSNLRSVVLPSRLTSLPQSCFKNCTALQGAELPSGITSISSDCFEGCSSLREVNLPDGLISIGSTAFLSCTSLESITLGAKLATIDASAFWGASIDKVIIEDLSSFLRISFSGEGSNPMRYADTVICDGEELIDVVIPEDIDAIEKYAFYHSSIRSVTLHDGVKSIGEYAFSGCHHLIRVTLGNGIVEISSSAFYAATSPKEAINRSTLTAEQVKRALTNVIYIGSEIGDSVLTTDNDGYTFAKVDGTVYLVDYIGEQKELSLPEYFEGGQYSVATGAFSYSDIKKVFVPSTVLEVRSGAFTSCDELKEFIMAPGVSATGVVVDGKKLYSVTVPYLSNIHPNNDYIHTLFLTAQTEVSSSMHFPYRLVTLGLPEGNSLQNAWGLSLSNFLSACPNLVEVYNIDNARYFNTGYAPDNFMSISHGFRLCHENGSPYFSHTSDDEESILIRQDGLVFVRVYDYNPEYNYALLAYEGDSPDVVIPDRVNGDPDTRILIANRAFDGMDIESVYIPSSVVRIETSAFYACEKLTDCVIEASDDIRIEYNAFNNCDNVIEVENGVVYVDKYVVDYSISKQDTVIVREGTVAIADQNPVLYVDEYKSVKTIVLPESLRWIGVRGLRGFESVERIIIPDGVKRLDDSFCLGCESMIEIVLPSGLEFIGEGAFTMCYSLEKITMPEGGKYTVCGNVLVDTDTGAILVVANGNVGIDGTAGISMSDNPICNTYNTVYISEGASIDGWVIIRGYLDGTIGYRLLHTNSSAGLIVLNSSMEYGIYLYESTEVSSVFIKSESQYLNIIEHFASSYESIGILSGVEHSAEELLQLYGSVQTVVFEGQEYQIYSDCSHEWIVSQYARDFNSFAYSEQCKHCSVRRDIPSKGEHVHELTVPGSILPTCDLDGWCYIAACTGCDLTYGYVLPATGEHRYSTWTEKQAPEHLSRGYDERVCLDCGAADTRAVSEFGHYYSVIEHTDATCTRDGINVYECDCGHTYTEIHREAYGHTIKGWWVPHIPSTCTEAGLERSYCRWCYDYWETRTVDPLGHDIVTVAAAVPTCEAIGWEEYSYCSRCESDEPKVTIPATGHTEGEPTVVLPTCEEQGYTAHSCLNCDYTYTDNYVEASGHSFVEGEVITAPTCTYKGLERVVCDVCLKSEERTLPTIDHTYVAEVTPPTCTQQGYTTHSCSCGSVYTDSYVSKTAHNMGVWKIIMHADCEYEGYRERRCQDCRNYIESETVPSLGHSYSEWVEEIPPTCDMDGELGYYFCLRCGRTFDSELVELPSVQISPIGHDFTAEIIPPSCEEIGYTLYSCENCQMYYTEDFIEPKGHTLIYFEGKPATCELSGYQPYETCSICDYTTYNELSAKGHSLKKYEAMEPTCEEFGWNAYERCLNCEYSTYEEIPATGHSCNSVMVEPTCTETGYTVHTCNCGFSYVDSYTDVTEHDYADWKISDLAGCDYDGLRLRECKACGHNEHERIPAPGHSLGEWVEEISATCESDGQLGYYLCGRCECYFDEDLREIGNIYIPARGHRYTSVVTTPPTCTEYGYNDHICDCGYRRTDDYVSPLGHNYGEWLVTNAPSCTVAGEERKSCKRCEHYEAREVAASGHTYTFAVTPPNCTENGYTTYTCACGDSYVDSYTDAMGHTVGEWIIDWNATTASTGQRHKECTVCSEIVLTEVIDLVIDTSAFEEQMDMVREADGREELFNQLCEALRVYNGYSAEQKVLVADEYAELCEIIERYNAESDNLNAEHDDATSIAVGVALLSTAWLGAACLIIFKKYI